MADTVICTPDNVFKIADQDMNPWEFFHGLIWLYRFTEMLKGHIEHIVGRMIISMYRLIFLNSSHCKIVDIFRVHAINHLHRSRACRRTMTFHRNNNSRFVGCATASLARGRTTKIRIIHLYEITQFIKRIPILHRFSYLVDHQPGSYVMNADHLFEPLSGTSALVGTNQKDCPEPLFQWCMCSMKYRINRNRGLMTAALALKNLALFHKIGFSMSASRTGKSIRPSKLFQILKTIIFRLKTFLKLKEIDVTVVAHVYPQNNVLSFILV